MQRGRLKVSLILTVLVICFIFPVLKPVHAQEAGYSHICYTTSTVPTINGQWSSDWSSGLQTTFGANAVFTDEYYMAAINPSTVYYYLIIETMDNTNDSKDFIQINLDGGMTADSAPTSTDFAINFTSNAVCTWYQGNGVGWTKIATPPSSVFQWGESFGSSPTYTTPHLILELGLLKTSTVLGSTQILGPEFWMLIETYDANSAGYGLQSWPAVPPSNPDVPTTYGDIPYTSTVNPASTTTLASSSAPTPTPTPTSTPTPTPTLSPTPSPTPSPSPSPLPTSSPTPTPSRTTAHPNSDTQTSSFGDTLFILGVIGMETLIVATHQASGRKQFPLPKKA